MKYIIKDWRYSKGKILKTFKTKDEVRAWVVDGLQGTEGCERDPYVNVLIWLETGRNIHGDEQRILFI